MSATKTRPVERHQNSTKFEVRLALGGVPTKIVGYAAVFDSPTSIRGAFGDYQEVIRPGAFSKTIKEQDIRALYNHNENFVLGRNKAGTLRLSEDNVGLRMEIDIPDTSFARDLVVSMERGDVNQSSFAFSPITQEWQRSGSADKPDERILQECRLYDCSVVTYPAYTDTVAAVRSLGGHPVNQVLARYERAQPLEPEDLRLLRQWLAEFELDQEVGPSDHPAEPPLRHSLEVYKRKLLLKEKFDAYSY